MVVGLDREQCGVKAKLPPEACLVLDHACALTEAQSSAASSCHTGPAHLGEAAGQLGGQPVINCQWIRSALPEKCMTESFQKATVLAFIKASRVAEGALGRGCWSLQPTFEDLLLFLSSRCNLLWCQSTSASSLIQQQTCNPSLILPSPQSRKLPRFAV